MTEEDFIIECAMRLYASDNFIAHCKEANRKPIESSFEYSNLMAKEAEKRGLFTKTFKFNTPQQ